MIRLILVAVVALFGCGLDGFTAPKATNSQVISQSPEQAESARLGATIVDLYKQGKYDEALPLAKRVLEIERGLGPERPAVAVALANLAELYFAKKKNSDAETLFQQAAAIYEKNKISSPPVSDILERLAECSFLKRRYDDAIALLERSLAIREQSYGAESLQVSETLHVLANVYQVDRKYERSEPLYLRSVTIKEKALGRTNPNTVAAMKDFACLQIKNMTFPPAKDETKTDLTEAEKAKKSVIERASCWLYGFKDHCDQESYRPPLQSSTVLNGKAIKLATPRYPVAAQSKHLSGTIYVAVMIDEEGKVIKAKPVCGGYPEFNDVAVGAARASRFTSTKSNDQAIQVTGLIVYRFVAQ